MSTTAEQLYNEGRYFGREEGEQTGLCKAAYKLRALRESGATIADACLHLDSLAGLDKPNGPDAKAVPAAVSETLASVAELTGGNASEPKTARDLLDQMIAGKKPAVKNSVPSQDAIADRMQEVYGAAV